MAFPSSAEELGLRLLTMLPHDRLDVVSTCSPSMMKANISLEISSCLAEQLDYLHNPSTL